MTVFVEHQFRPSETIDAVMRLRGRHNYTPQEIFILRGIFNELNGFTVPRAGQVYKIPLFDDVASTLLSQAQHEKHEKHEKLPERVPGGDPLKPADERPIVPPKESSLLSVTGVRRKPK